MWHTFLLKLVEYSNPTQAITNASNCQEERVLGTIEFHQLLQRLIQHISTWCCWILLASIKRGSFSFVLQSSFIHFAQRAVNWKSWITCWLETKCSVGRPEDQETVCCPGLDSSANNFMAAHFFMSLVIEEERFLLSPLHRERGNRRLVRGPEVSGVSCHIVTCWPMIGPYDCPSDQSEAGVIKHEPEWPGWWQPPVWLWTSTNWYRHTPDTGTLGQGGRDPGLQEGLQNLDSTSLFLILFWWRFIETF